MYRAGNCLYNDRTQFLCRLGEIDIPFALKNRGHVVAAAANLYLEVWGDELRAFMADRWGWRRRIATVSLDSGDLLEESFAPKNRAMVTAVRDAGLAYVMGVFAD